MPDYIDSSFAYESFRIYFHPFFRVGILFKFESIPGGHFINTNKFVENLIRGTCRAMYTKILKKKNRKIKIKRI